MTPHFTTSITTFCNPSTTLTHNPPPPLTAMTNHHNLHNLCEPPPLTHVQPPPPPPPFICIQPNPEWPKQHTFDASFGPMVFLFFVYFLLIFIFLLNLFFFHWFFLQQHRPIIQQPTDPKTAQTVHQNVLFELMVCFIYIICIFLFVFFELQSQPHPTTDSIQNGPNDAFDALFEVFTLPHLFRADSTQTPRRQLGPAWTSSDWAWTELGLS